MVVAAGRASVPDGRGEIVVEGVIVGVTEDMIEDTTLAVVETTEDKDEEEDMAVDYLIVQIMSKVEFVQPIAVVLAKWRLM